MKRFALVAALLALAAPRAVFAQVDRATVSGVVKDSGGAVVPGATVTVTNLATNVASQQTTTETGSYLVVNLIPGQYRIDVELTGFKKRSQTVTLEVGQRARVDMPLEVGNFAETVDVAGASPDAQHERRHARERHSADRRWPTCRSRSATGTTCSRSCPACRATATPSRAAARRSAAPAASTCTALARCRTTSCSTAWTTTASRRTSRS